MKPITNADRALHYLATHGAVHKLRTPCPVLHTEDTLGVHALFKAVRAREIASLPRAGRRNLFTRLFPGRV